MSINEYLEDRGIAKDPVNHPSHYETGKFECIDVMEEALGRDAVESFCICNAFKYLYRSKRKNGIEDLKKARWYLNRVIEMMEEDEDRDDGKGEFEDDNLVEFLKMVKGEN